MLLTIQGNGFYDLGDPSVDRIPSFFFWVGKSRPGTFTDFLSSLSVMFSPFPEPTSLEINIHRRQTETSFGLYPNTP